MSKKNQKKVAATPPPLPTAKPTLWARTKGLVMPKLQVAWAFVVALNVVTLVATIMAAILVMIVTAGVILMVTNPGKSTRISKQDLGYNQTHPWYVNTFLGFRDRIIPETAPKVTNYGLWSTAYYNGETYIGLFGKWRKWRADWDS